MCKRGRKKLRLSHGKRVRDAEEEGMDRKSLENKKDSAEGRQMEGWEVTRER